MKLGSLKMHIIGYVTQNLYINNHEIIIVESNEYIPHNYGQQEQVRVGSQQWQTKTHLQTSDTTNYKTNTGH